ncbi:MAG: ABC transporter substrate-binding protein [Clostridia bacterium]|nr:ABC transporter substrate-binding protein [Clostridia bacterium]MDD4387173.1 ABC transporter substrate-binding protein [Clostridia bacterium]
MKKKVYLFMSISVIITSVILSLLYFLNQNTVSDKKPLIITDTSNKEVTFTKLPEKVISLIPAATETIYDLNSQEKLIAIDSYSNYPDDTKNKTKLDTNTSLNIESIVNLNPDVVFMSKMGQTMEQYNNLINSGIKVVMVDASSIQETYSMINLIGKVLGKEKESIKIVSQMKIDLDNLKESVKNKETKTIYYEISPLEFGLWTSGNNTFENEIMQILNINNIFDDINGWSQVSEEQVLIKNPQYIITTTKDYGEIKAVDEIIGRKNWNNIEAVKIGQVYNIDPDIMSRPTKRLVEGAKQLKELIYGE